jgi:rhodanese-related sulfurtransferase
MLTKIKKLLGIGPHTDLKEILAQGATLVDVRTREEYAGGHIPGSINIPLNNLESNLSKIPKNKAVITCCASGMRSGAAKSLLSGKGYAEVHNGGGWRGLGQKIGKL